MQNFVTAARGHRGGRGPDPRILPEGAKTIGNFWVDLTRATIYVLLPIAFHFLAYLARHAGKVCTRRMILENVWDPGYRNKLNYLKVYAYRIRRKLGDERGLFVQSDPSVGYRLVPPGEGD